MKPRIFFALIFMFASLGFAAEEYYLYVQSIKAKVLLNPSFDAAVVLVVNRGAELIILGREGGWVKVKYGSQEGYVYGVVLDTKPPLENKAVKTTDKDIKSGARVRTSTSAVAGVRGLTPEERKRLSKDIKVNYDALDTVDTYVVTEEELQQFIEEGGK